MHATMTKPVAPYDPSLGNPSPTLLGGGTSTTLRPDARDDVAGRILAYLRRNGATLALALRYQACADYPADATWSAIDDLVRDGRVALVPNGVRLLPSYDLVEPCDTCGGTGYTPCGCEDDCEHGWCDCPAVLCDCPAGGVS